MKSHDTHVPADVTDDGSSEQMVEVPTPPHWPTAELVSWQSEVSNAPSLSSSVSHWSAHPSPSLSQSVQQSASQ